MIPPSDNLAFRRHPAMYDLCACGRHKVKTSRTCWECYLGNPSQPNRQPKAPLNFTAVSLKLGENKQRMVAARKAGNDQLAADLSQEKEVLKRKLRRYCLDCKTRISRGSKRCQICQRAHRHGTGRRLAVAALAVLCGLLWAGCSSKPVPVHTPRPSASAILMPSVVRAATVAQACPPLVITNGAIYTNCVFWKMLSSSTNTTYGQFSLTAYFTTNGVMKLETGNSQPPDWIALPWGTLHVWTLRYCWQLGQPWAVVTSVSNAMNYVQFNQSDAVQPSTFYQVAFQ
jgi:hypothetical protein